VEHVKLNPIKLESWLDYFQDLRSEQSETLRKKESSNNYTEPIDEEELDNILKKLKNNNAPGEDGLNLDLFKYAGKLFDRLFLKFLNTVWYEGTIPESWQQAIVIPVHKKGDINNQENYRGISLLNAGYKFYASILKIN
jgi:hypothetical protein